MGQESQADAVRQIEEALLTLRLGAGRGGPRPPWGDGPPPWAGGHGPGPLGARRRHDHEPHARGMHGGARIRLLEFLAGSSSGVGISEIAEAVEVDQPRASRLVADGAARGFVTRSVDPGDARKSVVTITDAGRQMLDTVRAGRTSAVTDALSGFTPDETALFAELLSRFAAAWPRPGR
ncbi:DNA-binding MarR family transcriptional regulator [Leifsonia sp. AK011]|uniref:MarR family winged helix-turn-helix transcriptional regulator n=1 Tax=Leifsonia sp. AK011 TaxID=2723075 RepID=UPI0015CCC659|nr:MarR family winged helix-turn-helix transcriptional regulator [Leifsonia sp. AK011]NYF09390.1 DNA-binding MarR family transcriptional regulator [Leifsonia sp. AK011]